MKTIDEYFKLQKEIHDYFDYVEDWKVIPLADYTDMHWIILSDGDILYFEEPLTDTVMEEGQFYSGRVYTQRFLDKHVYEKDDYTMVCLDTQCDGNKVLAVFETKKGPSKNLQTIEAAYKKFWPPMQF